MWYNLIKHKYCISFDTISASVALVPERIKALPGRSGQKMTEPHRLLASRRLIWHESKVIVLLHIKKQAAFSMTHLLFQEVIGFKSLCHFILLQIRVRFWPSLAPASAMRLLLKPALLLIDLYDVLRRREIYVVVLTHDLKGALHDHHLKNDDPSFLIINSKILRTTLA